VGRLDRMDVDRNVRKEDMREREDVERVQEKDRHTEDRLVDRKDRSGMANRRLDDWRRHDVDASGTWSPEGRQVGALQ
jgi:hypothetical protein